MNKLLLRVSVTSRWLAICTALVGCIACAASTHSQERRNSAGIVWGVTGFWEEDGAKRSLSNGDLILPGSLLRPVGNSDNHSIVLLLPDGQRILYECFLAADCNRGFRVPDLHRRADAFAIAMLAKIHAGLQTGSLAVQPHASQRGQLPKDEVVVATSPAHQVEIGGLVGSLRDEGYTYQLRSLSTSKFQNGGRLKREGATTTMEIPGAGLWQATIIDGLNNPRIDLFVAALAPEKANAIKSSFNQAKSMIAAWNEVYQGWPAHEFLRAYVAALVLNLPTEGLGRGPVKAQSAISSDGASEPVFSPSPGFFKRDVEVTLKCTTPEAEIHYTVDGSQPRADSPRFRFPIMVKGTALTIKAYASAGGKRDSPVVTGIFRIEQ